MQELPGVKYISWSDTFNNQQSLFIKYGYYANKKKINTVKYQYNTGIIHALQVKINYLIC